MRDPSGENRGWASNAIPEVSWVASPPAMGTVKRSPRKSKTMVSPSGLTSSEIQLPSVMSRGTSRSTSRGRPVSSGSSTASSSAPADCAGAALGPTGSAVVTPDAPIDAHSTSSRITTRVEPGSAPLAMRKRLRRGREPESRVGMRIVVFSFGVAAMVSTRRLERHASPSLTPEVERHRRRTRPRRRESRWMRPAAEEPITTCRATCDLG